MRWEAARTAEAGGPIFRRKADRFRCMDGAIARTRVACRLGPEIPVDGARYIKGTRQRALESLRFPPPRRDNRIYRAWCNFLGDCPG
jgi:hypothetical protein